MKNKEMKKTILSIILLSILLVSGCVQKESSIISGGIDIGQKESLCNAPYFEYKTGECCLDSNDNQICDNDEPSQSDVEHSAVRAIVDEKCYFSSTFDCPWFYVTKDEIQLRLINLLALNYITEIEIPNEHCENVKLNQVLKYNDEIKVNIPCKFEKDSINSDIVIYHIKEFQLDEKGNFNPPPNFEGYITFTTRGLIEGIVRTSEESKTEEAIQGVIKEDCDLSSIYFSCLKPSIDKESVNFYLENNGHRLNITKIEIPNIPCSREEDISFEKGDRGRKLITMECNFNKNTVNSDIIFYATIQKWNDNFNSFDEPIHYVLKGKISGIVR